MLRELLAHTGLEPNKTAALLGISPELFQEWIADQREIPFSIRNLLSNVVGLDLEPYLHRKVSVNEAASVAPAIWYKFRGEQLVPEDREFVLLVRRLGYSVNELEELTGAKAVGWRALFQSIRQQIDIQAPPRLQGLEAANMLRESRGLGVGAVGIGEALRGNLRAMGVLVIESPIPKSKLEGCCFYVGSRPSERPCVFANSHSTTWFRRNEILCHEIAHAIFDADSAGATLDFYSRDPSGALIEERADAFAQQMLVPRQVIQHIAQRNGVKWNDISAAQLGRLVADTHAEKRLVLRSALEGGFVSRPQFDSLMELDISDIVRKYSEHALSADEYIRIHCDADEWRGKRQTNLCSTSLRLPSAYVNAVVTAFRSSEISRGKAAEMLMVDDDTFRERFGSDQEEE